MRALAASLVFAASPAWAVYQCGDQVDSCQCGAPNPYPCCDNGGNCTWMAWENACCHWGVGLPGWGNANQWVGNANANASYDVHGNPLADTVSCRTLGTYGHVAYVLGLNSGGGVHVSEENCFANYGADFANYSSGFFQGFISRAGTVQCNPGDSQVQACGNCGTQSRGCGDDGKWGGWSACGAQGECAPGAVDSQACGTCGTHARTCDSTCHWGAFDAACTGADPDTICDTGLKGACAAGRQKCVGGEVQCDAILAPGEEVCDGLDNDCDGQTDEDGACSSALADRPSRPVAEALTAPQQLTGGCSAAPAPLVLVPLWCRRRRSSTMRGPSKSGAP